MPRYSVIIPTYGGSKRLSIVLDSLVRQSITQEFFEVIIVNDGDSKLAQCLDTIVSKYPELQIKTISLRENYGPAVARNKGMAIASGEVYFFTDDDCELPSFWMETHLSVYKHNPDISMVGGWYKPTRKALYDNLWLTLVHLRYESFFPHLYRTVRSDEVVPDLFPLKNTANLSIRRSVAAKVLFDQRFFAPGFEDSNFTRRVIEAGFIGLYIPLFVIHHKQMNFFGFFKLSLNRGLGRFVYYLIDYKFHSSFKSCCNGSIKHISMLSEINPHVRGRRFSLYIFGFIYCFVSNSSLFTPIYRFKYAKHKKKLQHAYASLI